MKKLILFAAFIVAVGFTTANAQKADKKVNKTEQTAKAKCCKDATADKKECKEGKDAKCCKEGKVCSKDSKGTKCCSEAKAGAKECKKECKGDKKRCAKGAKEEVTKK